MILLTNKFVTNRFGVDLHIGEGKKMKEKLFILRGHIFITFLKIDAMR